MVGWLSCLDQYVEVFLCGCMVYIHYIWGLCESVEVLLNKYEFELYNLSSSVPESYIAQMVYIFGS